MLRKNKAWTYALTAGPILGVIFPVLMNAFFSTQLLYFVTVIKYLFLVFTIYVLFSPLGNKKILTPTSTCPPRPLLLSIIGTCLIILLSSLLFISEASLLLQDAIQFHHIQPSQGPLLLKATIDQLYTHPSFYPWSLLAIIAVIFSLMTRKGEYIYIFSGFLPKIRSVLWFRLIQKNIALYMDIATRMFICSSIAFFIVQVYLSLNLPAINTLPGCITFIALMFISKTEKFKKLDLVFKKAHFPPAVMFFSIALILLIITVLMQFILSFLNSHSMGYTDLLFSANSRVLVFKHETWATTWQLWQWAWWVLATPVLMSLLAKCAYGRSLRTLILLIICPALCLTSLWCLLSSSTLQKFILLLSAHTTLLTIQSGIFLILLLLFLPLKSHHLFWLGFLPMKNPAKLRAAPFRRTYLTTTAIFGILIMSSLQGVVILQMLAAIACFIIYLVMAINIRGIERRNEHAANT